MRAFFEKLENGDKSQFFELLDQIDQKGIDLVQFAKQVIVYADQHLLENMDFYLKISQKLGDLLGVIRRYPHPRMAYKIVFNPFFDGEGVCVPSVQSKTVSKGDKKSDILPQISEQSTEKNQTSSFASSVQGLFSLPKEEFLDKAQYEKIKSMLNGIDLNNITPLQALQLLMKIKEEL